MSDTALDVARSPTCAESWRHLPCDADDGPAARASIGLIALANDKVIEPELHAFLPSDGVAVYASRIPMSTTVTPETLRDMEAHLAGAVELIMPDDHLDVMAFGCTSGSMAIGDERVAARIHESRPGIPCTNPITAGLEGLRKLGARRIALLTPYTDDVNAVVESFISERGFEIAVKGSFKLVGDLQITRCPPEAVYAAGLELGNAAVDALFISCTALRVSPIIGRLEEALAKPVVSSNQALAWHCLRLAGYTEPVAGYGRLLSI